MKSSSGINEKAAKEPNAVDNNINSRLFSPQSKKQETPCKLVAKETSERVKEKEETMDNLRDMTNAQKSRNNQRAGFSKQNQVYNEKSGQTQNSKSLTNQRSSNLMKMTSGSLTKSGVKGFSINNTALLTKLKKKENEAGKKKMLKVLGRNSSSVMNKNGTEKKEIALGKASTVTGKKEAKLVVGKKKTVVSSKK